MGAEFAEEHPEVAAALRLGPDSTEDPHVERMIMAFAYLTARIRHKLDDDFPEITDALLGVLYPHYLAPLPSTAIIEFQLDRAQGGLVNGYQLDREKMVETEPVGGEPCRFRTVYPVTLWPLEVTGASLAGIPASPSDTPDRAMAVLRLVLKCYAKDMTFSKLNLSRLRFYLNGQAQHVFALYEALLNNTLNVTVADATGDSRKSTPADLGRDCIQPVGFDEDQGIVPYPARSFPGYRLLTEYFTFPQKFCFFDLVGFTPRIKGELGNTIEICFHLGTTSQDLEQNITADTFRLGCTPMVNLFRQRAEPIQLTHRENEYRVVPDARRPLAGEVYSIDRVTATAPSGEEVPYKPFYSFHHAATRSGNQTFWYAVRRPSGRILGQADHGTEVFLSLVDLGFSPQAIPNWTVDVETTCLNRDLPARLPFGGGQPVLQLADGGPFSRITCLTPPTPTFRPPLGNRARWRLISHLNLNHLSISGEGESPHALREILKLYDFANSAETRSKIAGILGVSSRRAVTRLQERGVGEFCRGVEVHVQFDEERFSDNSLFLFASVLERFLGLYCSVNSFTQLSTGTRQRKGILRKWPPRAAQRVLL